MPFTPKFVDLVRNVTSVQGTGPVTLGAAVAGFTSLAAAAAPGEQFYYCIQGVDKPAEREVGRGTMQANGTVAREAVSGSLTNFTVGTKTIALVAAAEWFSRLDAMGAGQGTVSDAAALAAVAAPVAGEVRRTTAGNAAGLFRFDAGDLSARVAADIRKGIYVAPTAAPSGAAGAWVRQVEGPVNPLWFGIEPGTGNGAANSAALAAMFTTLRLRAPAISTNYRSCEPIRFPGGRFEFSSTIELTDGAFIIEGIDNGSTDNRATYFTFPAGVTGIRTQRHNTRTNDPDPVTPSHIGADGSIIRNLSLGGAYAGTESEAHGIQLRARALIENVSIQNFEGDGIHGYATSGGSVEGNANNSRIANCRINACRNGIYIDGADANIWSIIGLDCSANRAWGFADRSFLGNTYVACHAATNGSIPGSIATVVTHGGNRYGVKVGEDAWASVNAPSGTTSDNQGWLYRSAGGTSTSLNIAAWVSGAPVRAGGSYMTDSNNARNVLIGCYHESGQGIAQVTSPTLLVGGMISTTYGNGANLKGRAGYLSSNVPIEMETVSGPSFLSTRLGEQGGPTILFASDSVHCPDGWKLKHNGPDLRFDYSDSNGAIGFQLSGPATSEQFGTGAAAPYAFHVPRLMLGSTASGARQVSVATAAPSSGAHARGEVVFNDGSVTPIASVSYWRCSAGGTPGTWAAGTLDDRGGAVTSQAGAAYTAALSDANSYIRFTSAAAAVFTVPPDSAIPFPTGTVIEIEQAGEGGLSVAAGAGVTINARGGDLVLAGLHAVAALKKVAADRWTLTGDL